MTLSKQKTDFRNLVHNPTELSHAYSLYYDKILSDEGITWGIPAIDAKAIPMRGGSLTGLVARPGHGKSSMLAYLARKTSRDIVARGTQETEMVVYVTWESSAEEIETFFLSDGEFSASDVAWGRVPREKLMKKLIKRPQIPIWTIGHGLINAGKPTPRMYLSTVLECIESMEKNYGRKPILLLFDYLQLVPVEGANNRVEQVLAAPASIKELGLRVDAPSVCAVQASRAVDELKFKIPQPYHCQWGSSIEQAMDCLYGMWRPIKTEAPGSEPVRITPDKSAPITQELLVLQMTKQRGDAGRHIWALNFAPQYLRLSEMR